MASSAQRAELFCGGRRGAWRVQERVLSKPDVCYRPGLGRPAVVAAFGILVLPHAVADAGPHQCDDLSPVEHDLQVSPPGERTEQFHGGLAGVEQGAELDLDIAGVDRLVAGRLGLAHGREALQDRVGLVRLH